MKSLSEVRGASPVTLVAHGKLFKVIVVGNSNVGKTHIIERFAKGELPKAV